MRPAGVSASLFKKKNAALGKYVKKQLAKAPHKRLSKPKSRKSKKSRKSSKSSKIIRSPVNGESYSSCVVRYRKRKSGGKDFSEPTTITCDRIFTLDTVSNLQISENTFVAFMGENTQSTVALGSFLNSNGVVPYLWAQSQRDFINTVLDTSGTNIVWPPARVGQTDRGRKLFLHSCYNELVITSGNSIDCEIMIYDLMSKTTAGLDISAIPSAGVIGYYLPTDIWAVALQSEKDASGVIGPSAIPDLQTTRYGQNPQQYKYFNQKWKTVGSHRVHLSSGRSHIHKFTFHPNMLVDLDYFNLNYTVKGITYAQLITVRGIQNVTSSEGGSACLGSGPATVHCKSTSTYKVSSVYAPPRKRFVFENATAVNNVGQVQTMNQFTGAVNVGSKN